MDVVITLDSSTIFLQLILAMVLGMLLGTERAIAGKTVGMRTYALVSLGASLFIVISTAVTGAYVEITGFDPMRVAAGIVTGVGFLGAGIIIYRGSKLRGLTTAASLWVAAGIGVATGYQLYAVAIFTTFLTLLVFTILWFIEQKIRALSEGKEITTVEDIDDEEL